jgi:hypothetical protein
MFTMGLSYFMNFLNNWKFVMMDTLFPYLPSHLQNEIPNKRSNFFI